MDLKTISKASVPRALEMGERYRLLNEPDQAASICRDVLAVDPENQEALRTLLLALTDQFGRRGAGYQEAEALADKFKQDYDKAYYKAVVYERWGRSKLQEGVPSHIVGEWLHKAMALYEKAEQHKPKGDDSAILRWNTCARLMNRTAGMEPNQEAAVHLGD